MKPFMDNQFLLGSETARQLYHQYAAKMPIYDFHCHLPPQEIAEDRQYDNLGEIWLGGDHYKWRAMRANGISEKYCAGNQSGYEKFMKWAATVPQTIRNPLYHWTHLELRRYFGIDTVLDISTAKEIFECCTAQLQTPAFSVRNLMRKMNVKLVCTTDDPTDSLEYHRQIAEDEFEIKVLPAFRPDKAMTFSPGWAQYIHTLEKVSGVTIKDFASLLEAIDRRHAFFHAAGCRLSDHAVTCFSNVELSSAALNKILKKAMGCETVSAEETNAFQTAFLHEVGKMNHARGWVQQFHLGVFRNNNRRMMKKLGPDTGFDSIADYRQGPGLIKLLDGLDSTEQLAKTILYNGNPADNELIATMIGNYQDDSCPGKIQFGPSWWFLDQKDGIEKQLNALSLLGLLSRFVGMVTDSRSFLSYPRHEYFRRILCNLIGRDVENGELPADIDLLGSVVENICFNNAKNYFRIEV